ncbi:2-C-methyl-D-erythritol 4-phosphate cytidylyltransferase [Lysinibacter sp. HNR]|uniref:2-C-methyl-D-erythritol 4-phosphate cytidylyltransferase n=1 Tax=Lysinibacter sp. HNR TaxID=3031408 RepID=UPI002434F9EB|nr:2-C-methyl-D-erythritol 4-phosphate cytidylyltransferase [Lysinibacter sp. HNR]WGD38129.1 2-C-methyl-D-erythritol 4-phosphate cytidylyltransferase [Lysinibacter sp. HNR]
MKRPSARDASLPRVAVILVAAGSGTRLGLGIPKAFVPLAGRTILEWSLSAVAQSARVAQIIVVTPDGEQSFSVEEALRSITRVRPQTPPVSVAVVAGGVNRTESVRAGLASLIPEIDTVMVHDAARAATPPEVFDRVVSAISSGAVGAVPVLPVVDTLNSVGKEGVLGDIVDRSTVVHIQTPQGFARTQLVAAYNAVEGREFSDDASVMRAAGHEIRSVTGDQKSLKITTPPDLERVASWLEKSMGGSLMRVGTGTDVHRFDPGEELWLAGLYWPEESGLAGHSDGDVVAHAIVDALLSAAGLGDIGGLFGTEEEKFQGAHGEVFLKETARLLTQEGFIIRNVAVQLIGVRPKVSPRRLEAERVLSESIGAPVSLSATTTDGLGFTGRGEGLCAIATALIAVVDG